MLKEWFQKFLSLFENDVTAEIKERVTNPFFVSLAISWLFWNWKLAFILFNFHEEDPLNEKIWRIKIQLSDTTWCNLYLFPIFTAIGAILVLGLMNQASLAISVLFRRRIRPVIFKYVGYKDVVDIETYDKMKKRLYNLQEAYTSLEKSKSDTSDTSNSIKKERDDAKEEVIRIQNELFELKNINKKHTLEGLFQDGWTCEFTLPDGTIGEENVVIQDGYKYIRDSRHSFNLDMIEVKKDIIKYRKVNIDNERETHIGILKIISDNEYRGIEDWNTLISYKRHSTDIMDLKFRPKYEPNEIHNQGKSRITFKIANRTTRDLEILSYQFYNVIDGIISGEHPKHAFKREINASTEISEEFSEVAPIKYYFNSEKKAGIFDSEIHLEYRFLGDTEIKQCVSFARLIVTSSILVTKATYGSGTTTLDVTDIVRKHISKDNLEILVSNELFGDPIMGVQKALMIEYSINGILKNTSGVEGTSIKLE